MRRLSLCLGLLLLTGALQAAETSAKEICRKKIPGLKQQLIKNSDQPELWRELRACANELKEWNDAVEAAMVGKSKAPDNPEPRLILGMAHLQARDYDRAIEHLDKAIELDSKNPYAYFQMGMAYLFKNQPEQALAAAERAVEMEPANGAYQRQAAYVYLLTDQVDKAETAAKAAIAADADDIAAHKVLSKVYTRQGKTTEAAAEAALARSAAEKRAALEPPPPPVVSTGQKGKKKEEEEDNPAKLDDADIIADILHNWSRMKAAMARGDIEEGLGYFSDYPGTREEYRAAFAKMGPRTQRLFANFGELYDCEVVFLSASCKGVVRNDFGRMRSTTVRFERNPDKAWRIKSF